MTQRAFISSPPQTFFSGAKSALTTDPKDAKRRAHQTQFLKFAIRRSWSVGARITVAILPAKAEEGAEDAERIVGLTIWRPHGKRESPSMIGALRLGLLPVLVHWGFGRISEMTDASGRILADGYAERKLPGTSEDAWYLALAGVDPAAQRMGCMSLLLREAFNHAPNAAFTLEANTPRARDVYKHFGFEVIREATVGKGKINAQGVLASREAATGFPIYPMIRVPVEIQVEN
ncbi:hypothetical protein C8R46DRAFT_1218334 [Mycena filopes]|nr:hypothetical protein C8R46DRAFT_1218334 [Mycena filopes]